ncbi:MAG: zinc ribbon domain-containing protein [Alphaproteobacteria bacterium]
MPIYEHECVACGPFTDMRPMAQSSDPVACPDCGALSPRAFLTAPQLSTLSSTVRMAHATNERSAHRPKMSGEMREAGHRHGPGCGCSSSSVKGQAVRGRDGSKAFPQKRPWMISH